MIIFYNKNTGEIVGTVAGRIHDEEQIKNSSIKLSDTPATEIVKYVIPFKTVYREVEQPITELRMVDEITRKVERVVVGHKTVKESDGMVPDVPFADDILRFEAGENIHRYKLKLKNGEIIGFVKKNDTTK